MASEGYHEPIEWLDQRTIEQHRAVQSVVEELQAVDWYDQRVKATDDEPLKRILAHNRDEEKEHAAMGLEWWRRRDPVLDAALRTYLFTEGDIVAVEREAEAESVAGGGDGRGGSSRGDLGIGSLREEAMR
ncbi:MAG TPA: encapsulin-associated ferritin-like protein [Acidimicrobiia bacterium]|nr:encapsulin-associated ferritin-like protein [Acidimicrobiia bacterium]